MSSLAEHLETVREPGSTRCKLVKIREHLSEADQATLDEWMGDSDMFPAPVVAKALAAYGHPCSASTIRGHRRGHCPCYVGV